MRYTPKILKDNVNISKVHPFKEFLKMLVGLFVIVIAAYIILGLAVDIVAKFMPRGTEKHLASFYKHIYHNKSLNNQGTGEIQTLLDNLTQTAMIQGRYEVHVIKSNYVNAFALPGDKIIIFSELLKETETENELAFILAHELAHFYNKDHLKILGRRLVFFALTSVLFGQNDTLSDSIGNSLSNTEMKFSQSQEKEADLFALELVHEHYGHAGGVIDFFQRAKNKHHLSSFAYFFATHPHPKNRIKELKKKIKKLHYSLKEPLPLNPEIISSFKK